ncbi:DUF1990 domain-containing protein [Nocardia sp. AG03]|uniref:DUF1990 family protein n=1 Tax=Nocardia sp. AG03 TaxID=3025312 RepID=UPI0024188C94|nr:DUF1990 domain-containing protein [Nocardia sp. AG03]
MLDNPPLTYARPGVTAPAEEDWEADLPGYRRFGLTVPLGHGEALWRRVRVEVLNWEIKQRSGFRVSAADSSGSAVAREGGRYRIVARIGPLRIIEPAVVVAVVDTPDRCGFAYGTLAGHPVSGEEAFIVHRDPEGVVHLTLRSITTAAPHGVWRRVFPALLLAQRWYRRRYLRALR